MNLPNKLSLLRIFLVPVLVFFLVYSPSRWMHLFAGIIFAAASMTDLIDGYIARKWKQVTTLGKLLDPIADKLLVSAALISLVHLHRASPLAAMIIIGRELAITGLRGIAATGGVVIQASQWGKYKTVTQSAAILLLILYVEAEFLRWSGTVVLWLAVGLTLFSGYDYFRKFWSQVEIEA